MAKFRILSLDGGGILGAFSASFLAEIEQQLGGGPVGQFFDLIAGTSTGGIIAGALALGESAVRIRDFYRSDGPAIFERRKPKRSKWWRHPFSRSARAAADLLLNKVDIDTDYLVGTKYGAEALERSLKQFFLERTVGMATTRLLIPSVDLTRGDTVVFKTPHLPGRNSRDPGILMRDVIRATTAAPTFFPSAIIHEGSSYCDGGIWANNPAVVAYIEATKIREDCKRECDRQFELHEIEMLSIGTGEIASSLESPGEGAGLAFWMAGRITEWMMLAQGRGTEHQAKYLMGNHLHRINFPLPDKKTWALDSKERIGALFHLGSERAHAYLAALRPVFFQTKAASYEAFKN